MSHLRIALLFLCVTFIDFVNASALPSGFVYISDVVPSIVLDMRYTTSENFIGTPIEGYIKPVAIATKEAAIALNNVQTDLQRFGLSLKIYDAYRPQRAVDHFVRWSKDLTDVCKQTEYYRKVAKEVLFQEGYIASKSGHSRGSTFDLTLVSIGNKGIPRELDMGTPFDLFDPKSGSEYADLTTTQRANRKLLKTVMEKQGFKPYPKEWWHFTLKEEPYPDTYFNFVID